MFPSEDDWEEWMKMSDEHDFRVIWKNFECDFIDNKNHPGKKNFRKAKYIVVYKCFIVPEGSNLSNVKKIIIMPRGKVILHGCNKHNYSNYIESIGDFSMEMGDDGFVTKLTVFTKAIFHSSTDVKSISGVTMDNWKKQKLNLNCEIVTNSKLNERVQIQYLFNVSRYEGTLVPNWNKKL